MADDVTTAGATATETTTTASQTGAVSDSGATDTKTTETKTATILSDGGKTDDEAAAADWPSDWRQKLAGEDDKALKQLERMATPGDVFKSFRVLQQKFSSGEFKAPLAKDATPEQIATWRKDNGIPEKPEDYKIELPDGMVLGDADKPLVASFTKSVHDLNWKPEQVNQALAWYYTEQDRLATARAESDATFKRDAEDELRAEFGPEFRPNLSASGNMMAATFPDGLSEEILAARTPSGKLLGDHPQFVKAMVALARELNPAGALVPAGNDGGAKGLSDRIADLEKMMGDHGSDYWRGPKADAMQKEYRDLITARDKMKARAA